MPRRIYSISIFLIITILSIMYLLKEKRKRDSIENMNKILRKRSIKIQKDIKHFENLKSKLEKQYGKENIDCNTRYSHKNFVFQIRVRLEDKELNYFNEKYIITKKTSDDNYHVSIYNYEDTLEYSYNYDPKKEPKAITIGNHNDIYVQNNGFIEKYTVDQNGDLNKEYKFKERDLSNEEIVFHDKSLKQL